MTLVFSVGWLALVVWLIVRAWRQRRALQIVTPREWTGVASAPRVAVIVPARNESANMAPCLRSLLVQDYPADRLRILVVDDDSSDDTAAVAAAYAARDRRITLLHAPALPPGWKGKVHACWTGACAVPSDTEWLCFLDADMRAEPLLIASAVEAARVGRLDLLSLAPSLALGSFAERLMIPCGFYLLAFSQDLARVQASDNDEAVAMGQFMMFNRAVYDSSGGHAAVRTSISEDVALARRLKHAGRRVLLEDGGLLLSGRMYTGWSTLWPGLAKNLTDMLGGPLPTVATALITVTLAWTAVLLPFADLIGWLNGSAASLIALAVALLGSAVAFGLHVAGAIHFRIPFWYGLLFPLGYTAGAGLAIDSLRQRLVGRVHWKGRVYS